MSVAPTVRNVLPRYFAKCLVFRERRCLSSPSGKPPSVYLVRCVLAPLSDGMKSFNRCYESIPSCLYLSRFVFARPFFLWLFLFCFFLSRRLFVSILVLDPSFCCFFRTSSLCVWWSDGFSTTGLIRMMRTMKTHVCATWPCCAGRRGLGRRAPSLGEQEQDSLIFFVSPHCPGSAHSR